MTPRVRWCAVHAAGRAAHEAPERRVIGGHCSQLDLPPLRPFEEILTQERLPLGGEARNQALTRIDMYDTKSALSRTMLIGPIQRIHSFSARSRYSSDSTIPGWHTVFVVPLRG